MPSERRWQPDGRSRRGFGFGRRRVASSYSTFLESVGSLLPLPSLRRLLSTRLLRILALVGVATACGTTGGHTLARIRHDGFVRIGYAVEAPYAYLADGRVTGESPEVARAIFARLGIDSLVWVQQDFGALIDDLRRGRFDVIAAWMFITPERERQIAFSVPTFCVTAPAEVMRTSPELPAADTRPASVTS